MNFSSGKLTVKTISVISFFAVFLLIGLFIYDDYGVSWDERISQMNGVVSALYVAKLFFPGHISTQTLQAFPDLHHYVDKDYGVLFEISSFAIEQIFHLTDVRDLYLMRHLATFLTFYISVYFFYKLVAERFKNWQFGLLGAFFLILSPRIFGDAFYNSKDLVFMALFGIACYTMVNFIKQPTFKTALWHAFATACAIDVRVTGICIPMLTAAALVVNFFGPEAYRFRHKQFYSVVAVFCIFSAGFILLFWPFLWQNPIGNFLLALKNMSAFRWENPVLYMGEKILSTKLPWHYFPVWLFITTPLLYSFLFLAGIFFVFRNWLSNFRQTFKPGNLQQDLFFVALLFIPALSIIILHAVLYDGWRQLYFLYIPFLYLALCGLFRLWQEAKNYKLAPVLALIVVLQCAHTLFFMVQNHPFQFAYFSFLRGKAIEENFERDYWGVSVRRGLEYILETDSRPVIKVSADGELLALINNNKLLLPLALRNRLQRVKSTENPDYLITNYRILAKSKIPDSAYFSVTVQGAKLMSVFKLK